MARGGLLLAVFALFLLRFFCQDAGFARVQQISEDALVVVEGQIYKKDFKKDAYLYYLNHVKVSAVSSEHIVIHVPKVCVRINNGACQIGDNVMFQAEHRWMEQRRNSGAFDERQYYHSLGIATLYYIDDMTQVIKRRPAPVRNGLFYLREQMRQVYAEELNEKDAGILASMVLGDKSLMEEELKGLYSAAGISHILAVSGLHVSLIGMTIFKLMRKGRRKYPASCLSSGICLLLFCIMSGMSISALRAGIMFLIYLGAQLLGRKYNSFRGMMIAAGITLFWNPAALYNAGFWLSYLAVAGAVGLGNICKIESDKIDKKNSLLRQCKSILGSMWISSAIMLATLPVTAYFFCEIPLYGVLANLVILPLAGVVMGFGLIGGFLGLTNLPGMWICFVPCHFVLRIYEGTCRFIRWLPMESFITGQPKLWMLFVYYGMLIGGVWLLRNWKPIMCATRIRQLAFFPGTAVLVLMLFMIFPVHPAFQVSFLDVGQGDGICINDGSGRTFFIDGGSTSEKELGKYQLLPFLKSQGIRKIDGWIVTHADQDHISGMLEVIESGYPVGALYVSEYMIQDENSQALLLAAETKGITVVTVTNGDYILDENYRMRFFTPESGAEDRNEASLVTMLEYKGTTFLFTGDIGIKQERWLCDFLNKINVKPDDSMWVLKAAHHGSKYSNGKELLEYLSPEWVVVSAGEDNSYGHPHQQALDRIDAAGSQRLITMDTGEITFGEQRGKLWLKTMFPHI